MFEFSPSQVSEAVRTDLRVTLVKGESDFVFDRSGSPFFRQSGQIPPSRDASVTIVGEADMP